MAEEKKDAGKGAKVKLPTAQKREIQNAKRQAANRSFRARANTVVRKFEKTSDNLNEVFSLLDKGAKKGLFKKNKANRLKSRFAKKAAKAS